MCSLLKNLEKPEVILLITMYNIELFVEMYIYLKDSLYSTMLIFETESYIVIGCKSLKNTL